MNGQGVREQQDEEPEVNVTGASSREPASEAGGSEAPPPGAGEEGPPPRTLAEDEEGGPTPPAAGRRRSVLPWVIAALAVLLAIGAAVYAYTQRAGDEEEQQAATVASEALIAVMNWDADSLDEVRGQLDEIGTERLRGEAEEILGEVAEPLTEAGAVSEGEVVDLVVDASRGEGVAMGIVRQTISSETMDNETQTCWGVRVMLTQEGDRWLADRLEPYGPGDCPTG